MHAATGLRSLFITDQNFPDQQHFHPKFTRIFRRNFLLLSFFSRTCIAAYVWWEEVISIFLQFCENKFPKSNCLQELTISAPFGFSSKSSFIMFRTFKTNKNWLWKPNSLIKPGEHHGQRVFEIWRRKRCGIYLKFVDGSCDMWEKSWNVCCVFGGRTSSHPLSTDGGWTCLK